MHWAIQRTRTHHRRRFIALLGFLSVAMPALAAGAEDAEFFEKKVRPLLVERCYECHSAEKKVKGGLRLDTREGWQTGGDTGPALVPGKPEESLLITAIRYRDKDMQMPPKKQLTAEEVAVFEQWVAMGAPDPRIGDAVAKKQTGLSPRGGPQVLGLRAAPKNGAAASAGRRVAARRHRPLHPREAR